MAQAARFVTELIRLSRCGWEMKIATLFFERADIHDGNPIGIAVFESWQTAAIGRRQRLLSPASMARLPALRAIV